MTKSFFVLLLVALFMCSCGSYGEKIKINDTIEVFLKGDSVSETEGRKLGNYIAALSGNTKNRKSFQLSKDSGIHIVKMVIDKGRISDDPGMDSSFLELKTSIEQDVFQGKRVKFVITDDHFKPIKTY